MRRPLGSEGAFRYREGALCVDGVRLEDLARRFGTPLYVVSASAIRSHVAALRRAFSRVAPLLCYSVKANPTGGVLELLRREGCGFDVVSGGELHRALRAGAPPETIVYEGAGKTRAEIEEAVRAGILLLGIENEDEIPLVRDAAAAARRTPALALRLNPGVEARTHPYIRTGRLRDKFGLRPPEARRVLRALAGARDVRVAGLHVHVGSQIEDPRPYRGAIRVLAETHRFARRLGHPVEWIDLGGGFGVSYGQARNHAPERFARPLLPALEKLGARIILEPGRFLVANAAVLVTTVLYRKVRPRRRFLVADAAMNDLLRPALYGARHEVLPLAAPDRRRPREIVDIVGPICETGDVLALGRRLPAMEAGERLALLSAGAYGAAMASNYNSRPRAAEVLVDGRDVRLLARRETRDELVQREAPLERSEGESE